MGRDAQGHRSLVDDKIVGLLQAPYEYNNVYAGIYMVEYTEDILSLINALLADPRGLLKYS